MSDKIKSIFVHFETREEKNHLLKRASNILQIAG